MPVIAVNLYVHASKIEEACLVQCIYSRSMDDLTLLYATVDKVM